MASNRLLIISKHSTWQTTDKYCCCLTHSLTLAQPFSGDVLFVIESTSRNLNELFLTIFTGPLKMCDIYVNSYLLILEKEKRAIYSI